MHDMGSACGKAYSSTVKKASSVIQNNGVKVEGMFSEECHERYCLFILFFGLAFLLICLLALTECKHWLV